MRAGLCRQCTGSLDGEYLPLGRSLLEKRQPGRDLRNRDSVLCHLDGLPVRSGHGLPNTSLPNRSVLRRKSDRERETGSCGAWSVLPLVELDAGTYYVTIEGQYPNDCGPYRLDVHEWVPCAVYQPGDVVECAETDSLHPRLDCNGGCGKSYHPDRPRYQEIACGRDGFWKNVHAHIAGIVPRLGLVPVPSNRCGDHSREHYGRVPGGSRH